MVNQTLCARLHSIAGTSAIRWSSAAVGCLQRWRRSANMPFPAQTTGNTGDQPSSSGRAGPTKRPPRSQRAGYCVLDGRSVSTSFSWGCSVFSVRLGVGCANRGRIRRMGRRGMGCVDPGRGRRFEAAQGTLSPGGTANGSFTQQHPNAGLSLVSPPINTMQA